MSLSPYSRADAAEPAAVCSDAKVVSGQSVPLGAMGLPSVEGGRRHSSKDIHLARNRFEVLRVHTVPNSAKVVEFQPFGHGAIGVFPEPFMGEPVVAAGVPSSSVTICPDVTLPKPAGIGFLDQHHELFKVRGEFCPAPLPHAVAVFGTHSAVSQVGAVFNVTGILAEHRATSIAGVVGPDARTSRLLPIVPKVRL